MMDSKVSGKGDGNACNQELSMADKTPYEGQDVKIGRRKSALLTCNTERRHAHK